MTKVHFDAKELSLTMKGHAGYAEEGKDIVCAAVSILFYTLAEALEKSGALATPLEKSVDEGEVSLKATPKKGFEGNVSLIFYTILSGIQLLVDDYKDYVELIY